jgi:hypothetical protein
MGSPLSWLLSNTVPSTSLPWESIPSDTELVSAIEVAAIVRSLGLYRLTCGLDTLYSAAGLHHSVTTGQSRVGFGRILRFVPCNERARCLQAWSCECSLLACAGDNKEDSRLVGPEWGSDSDSTMDAGSFPAEHTPSLLSAKMSHLCPCLVLLHTCLANSTPRSDWTTWRATMLRIRPQTETICKITEDCANHSTST